MVRTMGELDGELSFNANSVSSWEDKKSSEDEWWEWFETLLMYLNATEL